MKYGNGTVKKYSREYTRTLKNGSKKKYKTEQIQITVPKQEDIYKNGEEVLIIPEREKEKLFELLSTNSNEEIFYDEEDDPLLSELNDEKENFKELENKYNELAEKYNELIEILEIMKKKEIYNKFIHKKYKRFIFQD